MAQMRNIARMNGKFDMLDQTNGISTAAEEREEDEDKQAEREILRVNKVGALPCLVFLLSPGLAAYPGQMFPVEVGKEWLRWR